MLYQISCPFGIDKKEVSQSFASNQGQDEMMGS